MRGWGECEGGRKNRQDGAGFGIIGGGVVA